MSEKSFTVTEGQVLALAKECPDARRMLEKGFPEAFVGKWVDITEEMKWSLVDITSGYWIKGEYRGDTVCWCGGTKMFLDSRVIGRYTKNDFKIENTDVPSENEGSQFRIYKKEIINGE